MKLPVPLDEEVAEPVDLIDNAGDGEALTLLDCCCAGGVAGFDAGGVAGFDELPPLVGAGSVLLYDLIQAFFSL